jgi:hypothetical protein
LYHIAQGNQGKQSTVAVRFMFWQSNLSNPNVLNVQEDVSAPLFIFWLVGMPVLFDPPAPLPLHSNIFAKQACSLNDVIFAYIGRN